jgi:hypothetical protein
MQTPCRCRQSRTTSGYLSHRDPARRNIAKVAATDDDGRQSTDLVKVCAISGIAKITDNRSYAKDGDR